MSTRELLFLLLKYELTGDKPSDSALAHISPEEAERIYELAKKHEVIAPAAHAMIALGVKAAPETVLKLQKQMMLAKHHYELMTYEIGELSRVLSDAQIPHILLKGSVLRERYPIPWLRTSCDVDVLVKRETLDAAISALAEKLKYEVDGRTPHDIPLNTPSGVHIELHFTLMGENVIEEREPVCDEIWDRATKKGDSYRFDMPDEMFYYYHVIHMAKHVITGGCGIRPFLDLWVLEELVPHDNSAREALLSRGGILKFSEACVELMKIWLDSSPHTERSEMLEKYVMYGGVYGNIENKVSIQQSQRGGKRAYAMSRIFPSYSFMRMAYPVLDRHKWLLPVMYVRRWIRVIRRGRLSASVAELKYNGEIPEEEMLKNRRFLSEIGLQ